VVGIFSRQMVAQRGFMEGIKSIFEVVLAAGRDMSAIWVRSGEW
jgi:hypothetical protein